MDDSTESGIAWRAVVRRGAGGGKPKPGGLASAEGGGSVLSTVVTGRDVGRTVGGVIKRYSGAGGGGAGGGAGGAGETTRGAWWSRAFTKRPAQPRTPFAPRAVLAPHS